MTKNIILLLIVSLFLGIESLPGKIQPGKTVRVKYVSAEHVYLDAGSSDGFAVGDRLRIKNNGLTVAEIEIVYLSEHSASCKIISSQEEIRPGHTAELYHTQERESKKETPDTATVSRKRNIPRRPAETKPPESKTRLSGSVSLQYYYWQDQTSSNLDFSQPTLRLNIKGRHLWGTPLQFRIKTRTRYNHRSRRLNANAPEHELRNRIYEASIAYENDHARFNYRFGRIISHKFSGIGYIDGLLLQHNITQTIQAGVFAGTQPEWHYADFQTAIQKYGIYLNYQKGAYQNQRFESTLAAAGEYHGTTVSREFIYLQNSFYASRKWNVYQSAELEINRHWRKARNNQDISISNLYVSGRYSPYRWITLGLMYDNRKNYQTYQTRSIADSLFDDALRYGLRGTISLLLPENYRLYTNFGIRKRKTDTDYTYSYAGGINKINFLMKRLSIFINGTGFSNFFTTGYNYSFRIAQSFRNGYSLNIGAGGYIYELKSTGLNQKNRWIRLGGRASLSRHFYLYSQYEYNDGDDVLGHRVLAEIGYRF